MSTERNDIISTVPHGSLKSISSTSYYGGSAHGRCLQLTQTRRDADIRPGGGLHGYIQVDRHMALALIAELSAWLVEDTTNVDAVIEEQF